jgi:nicotinamidase-related amidase/predicted MFS family arabinose efflux permease
LEADTPATHPLARQREIADRPFGPRFVTPLFMGSALNPINSSVIATALVSIAAAMGVSVGQTSILISSLYLTSAIAQPTAGRLSEEFGPRRVFLTGIAIVLVGGIVGGLAQNLPTLVVSRVLIGLGTSAGYPSAMLLIRRRATAVGLASAPGTVLGGLAIAGSATVAIGPTVGGLLVGWFDWRAAFLINVPIACATFATALLWIAKDPDRIRGRSAREVIARIDLTGVIGFAGAMTALLVFLLSLPHPAWSALGVSIAIWAALVTWELRAGNPFLDVRLLVSNLPLTRTYIRQGLTLLGTYVILYGLTQWVEAAHGLSAYDAGLILIPMGALSAVAARVVSRRDDIRGPLIASALMALVGAVATLFLTSDSPIVAIVAVTALFGLMSGSSNVTNQTALYKQAPAERVGTASGLLRTFGYVGSIAAATITGVAFRTRVDDAGLHDVSLILIGIGIVVLVMTVLDRQLGRSDAAHLSPNHREEHPHMSTSIPPIVAARTALLLMDFQPAVLGAIGDTETLLARAHAALSWARAEHVRVVYVRVAFAPEDFAAIPTHNKAFAAVAENRFLADGSPESAIDESFEVQDDDIVVRKTRFGAFSTTDLYARLHREGIDTLVVAGISTSGVVLSTLRDAADEDYRLYVLSDATADPDPDVHRILTERVFPHQADVIETGDLRTLSAPREGSSQVSL